MARPSIMHLPSQIGASPGTGAQDLFIFANAGAYVLAGTALTTAATSLSNREQENTIGSKIGTTTIDLSITTNLATQFEIAVMKIERERVVPVPNDALPTNAEILTLGLQAAARQRQPGRVVHFSVLSIAAEQPRTKRIRINWRKYKMGTIRTGDFYLIIVFNRQGGASDVDYHVRYKEYK